MECYTQKTHKNAVEEYANSTPVPAPTPPTQALNQVSSAETDKTNHPMQHFSPSTKELTDAISAGVLNHKKLSSPSPRISVPYLAPPSATKLSPPTPRTPPSPQQQKSNHNIHSSVRVDQLVPTSKIPDQESVDELLLKEFIRNLEHKVDKMTKVSKCAIEKILSYDEANQSGSMTITGRRCQQKDLEQENNTLVDADLTLT